MAYDRFFTEPGRGLVEVGCWAHSRRHAYQALEKDQARMGAVLAYIGQIYASRCVRAVFASLLGLTCSAKALVTRENISAGKSASKSSSAWQGTPNVSSIPGKTVSRSVGGNGLPEPSVSSVAALRT